jgi:hypothetical protein
MKAGRRGYLGARVAPATATLNVSLSSSADDYATTSLTASIGSVGNSISYRERNISLLLVGETTRRLTHRRAALIATRSWRVSKPPPPIPAPKEKRPVLADPANARGQIQLHHSRADMFLGFRRRQSAQSSPSRQLGRQPSLAAEARQRSLCLRF